MHSRECIGKYLIHRPALHPLVRLAAPWIGDQSKCVLSLTPEGRRRSIAGGLEGDRVAPYVLHRLVDCVRGGDLSLERPRRRRGTVCRWHERIITYVFTSVKHKRDFHMQESSGLGEK